jgi:hypothetical protein
VDAALRLREPRSFDLIACAIVSLPLVDTARSTTKTIAPMKNQSSIVRPLSVSVAVLSGARRLVVFCCQCFQFLIREGWRSDRLGVRFIVSKLEYNTLGDASTGSDHNAIKRTL